MKNTIAIILITLSIIGSGCAWFKTETEKSAEELNEDGRQYFEDERYKKAIESYKKLKDWYPFSKYATNAELKIADAHFEIEEYPEAISAYEEFENLHPTNENIPYVIYQIGRCYFVQLDTIDRDQATAQKALETFNRLIKSYPKDQYVIRAKEHIKDCLKSMAANEIYVGLFYFNSKKYKAAQCRFKSVIENYPDVGLHKSAFQYLAMTEAALRDEPLNQEKDKAKH